MKRKRINWRIVGALFIGLLMVGSTIGFLVGPFGYGGDGLSQQSIRVNGFKLDVVPGGYETKVGDAIVAFTYSPAAANRTKIPQQAFDQIRQGGYVFMTSDPNSTNAQDIALVQYQLAEMLSAEFNVQSALAFTRPFQAFPVITCANASQFVPVIVFEDANVTGASYQNGCLVLTAESQLAYVELRDRLVYGLFGILR